MKEYKAGTKAYYDAHVAVLKCEVSEVIEEGNGKSVSSGKLKIKLEETKGAFKKGEVMDVSGYHTFPRECKVVSGFRITINPNYRWVK